MLISFDKLIRQIDYKAEEVGIEEQITEESYTSKIDHFVFELMQKQKKYLDRKINQG